MPRGICQSGRRCGGLEPGTQLMVGANVPGIERTARRCGQPHREPEQIRRGIVGPVDLGFDHRIRNAVRGKNCRELGRKPRRQSRRRRQRRQDRQQSLLVDPQHGMVLRSTPAPWAEAGGAVAEVVVEPHRWVADLFPEASEAVDGRCWAAVVVLRGRPTCLARRPKPADRRLPRRRPER